MAVFTMRRFALGAFLLGIVPLGWAGPAHAQLIVFDNGAPDYVSNYVSTPGSSQYIADTFTFTTQTSFNQIIWYGINGTYTDSNPGSTDNFTLALYNTTDGIPNSAAFTTFAVGVTAVRTLTSGTNYNFVVYQYTYTVKTKPTDPVAPNGMVTLGPGTYGLGIVNIPQASPWSWAWVTSGQTGQFFSRHAPTDNYQSATGNMAFRLVNTNAVAAPEPSALALVAPLLPLAGLIPRRRKRAAGNT